MNARIHMAGKWWPLQPDHLDGMKAACAESWEYEVVDALAEWWSEETNIVSLTSGSTGMPKSIHHNKKAIEASALRTIQFFGLTDQPVASLVMPARYIGGKMMLIRALIGGWDLRVVKPAVVPFLQPAPDFVAMTVSQASSLIDKDPSVWKELKLVLLGGSPVDDDLVKRMPAGPKVFESFGMTETISHFALRQLAPQKAELFTCLKGFHVRSSLHQALVVVFPDGTELVTNDAVEIRSVTTFRWLGRLDDVINSGGIKIHPSQVEALLSSLIDLPFKVYGEPHPQWGNQLVIRVHADAAPSNAAELEAQWMAWAMANLPPYHAPKRIEWKRINQTASGKWLRP